MAQVNQIEFQPRIVPNFLEEAKRNTYWKRAFATGEQEQIVFMNISPQTNPNNEIGEETHPFDQVIFIVEGKGKAMIGDQSTSVQEGDLIFVPLGIKHNVVNSNRKKSLKLVSFYSNTDMPKDAVYEIKTDSPDDTARD